MVCSKWSSSRSCGHSRHLRSTDIVKVWTRLAPPLTKPCRRWSGWPLLGVGGGQDGLSTGADHQLKLRTKCLNAVHNTQVLYCKVQSCVIGSLEEVEFDSWDAELCDGTTYVKREVGGKVGRRGGWEEGRLGGGEVGRFGEIGRGRLGEGEVER